jgi:PAS domain S-box-containing protein
MRFFKLFEDLKIRHKLLLGYISIFIFSSVLASTTIYHFVRETIESNIESELQNSTIAILNMVRNAANVSIKNYLRAVAEKNKDIARDYYQQYRQGLLSEKLAKQAAGKVLLSQTIGKTGYIYCLSSNGIMEIHPHEALLGADLSQYAFIQEQKRHKAGYVEYDWRNPSEPHARAKALYMTYFAPWDWIISVSSYRNEFKELINVDDFRDSVMSLKFGKTGYSYVIDTKGTLILHPKLEGINILTETDAEGQYFVKDLIDRRTGKITYSWKNPGEHYRREKLVIFNYIPEYDWIVASSSYLDEFYAPLQTIEKIFVLTVFLSLLLVLPLTFWISASITNPLGILMRRLARGAQGDEVVPMERVAGDEVGTLARYFNSYVTEARAAEMEMARMRLFLQKIVDSMPSILVGVDLTGRITLFNREAENHAAISSQDALGRSVDSVFPQLSSYNQMVGQAIAGKTTMKSEKVAHPAHRNQRWADIMVYPIQFGKVEGAVIRIDDVTDRARMENVMVQTEKMMSVGGLAAGMAHEINNPLGAMVQSAQNIIRRLSPDLPANKETAEACGVQLEAVRSYLNARDILKFLEGIRTSGQNAAEIVDNMLHFSRTSESRKMPVQLSTLLERTVSLAAHDYDLKKNYDFRSIRIERVFRADLDTIACVATEIEQVVLNLLRNAAQAMADHGQQGPAPRITLRLYNRNNMAVIEVEDNGPGMNAQQIKRVFEPFFTTKDVGVGTGLGLSVSYFIITNNHGGTMEVSSEPGKGARFTVRLPMTDHTQEQVAGGADGLEKTV